MRRKSQTRDIRLCCRPGAFRIIRSRGLSTLQPADRRRHYGHPHRTIRPGASLSHLTRRWGTTARWCRTSDARRTGEPAAQRLADDAAGVAGPIWNDRRIGSVAAVGAGALWGAPAGWWTPRGPLTTGQAIWSIVVSLAVGATAGIIVRSRWAMLATPVAFAAVFELVRAGTDGPTVDRISTSTYGLIAFVVSRGFHALISLLPMAYGASLGAGIARQLAPASSGTMHSRRWWLYTKRGSAVLAGIGLLAFTVMLARPASTDPIVDADGNRIPGSIAELTTVDVNGHDLTMLIRGHSVDNPVLLFLAGGPGGSEMGAMRRHVPELEEHFTVVTWDQRGTGHAYGQLDPTDTLTLDSAIDDTLAVTDYPCQRTRRLHLRPLPQLRGPGPDVGEPVRRGVRPHRPDPHPRGLHGHLQRALPPTPGHRLP